MADVGLCCQVLLHAPAGLPWVDADDDAGDANRIRMNLHLGCIFDELEVGVDLSLDEGGLLPGCDMCEISVEAHSQDWVLSLTISRMRSPQPPQEQMLSQKQDQQELSAVGTIPASSDAVSNIRLGTSHGREQLLPCPGHHLFLLVAPRPFGEHPYHQPTHFSPSDTLPLSTHPHVSLVSPPPKINSLNAFVSLDSIKSLSHSVSARTNTLTNPQPPISSR
ncbi:hypothetical protein DL98DRAFT_530577 [Cadophora sp. DSE1049]|nr:hypothetical protein DL98DRAFT_530577 [Cadophora sp. DSE1049]